MDYNVCIVYNHNDIQIGLLVINIVNISKYSNFRALHTHLGHITESMKRGVKYLYMEIMDKGSLSRDFRSLQVLSIILILNAYLDQLDVYLHNSVIFQVDKDGTGSIDLPEFLAMMAIKVSFEE